MAKRRSKRIAKKIYRWVRILHDIGSANFFRYFFARNGQRVQLIINNHDIIVRKGTPDLRVAVSSLSGEFEILRHLLPAGYQGVIVDAGGYIGTAAIALRDIFPKAKLLTIEPSSENLAVLKGNIANLQNIEVVHGALVGTTQQTIQLNDRGTGEWGFTVVSQPRDRPDASPIQEVPAVKLSDLLAGHESVGLLKLDIEGGELALLEHDSEALRDIDIVFAELHDRIAPGCLEKFLEFSEGRILVKDRGEKYLSIKR